MKSLFACSVPRYPVKIAYIGLVKQPEGCSSLSLSLLIFKNDASAIIFPFSSLIITAQISLYL